MSLRSPFSMKGKKVVATGAGKGTGYGVAKEPAKAGACVALVARTESLLEAS